MTQKKSSFLLLLKVQCFCGSPTPSSSFPLLKHQLSFCPEDHLGTLEVSEGNSLTAYPQITAGAEISFRQHRIQQSVCYGYWRITLMT